MITIIIVAVIVVIAAIGYGRYLYRKHNAIITPCKTCGDELFTCKRCGCVYNTAHEALRCADWDRILKHDNHRNHHHE